MESFGSCLIPCYIMRDLSHIQVHKMLFFCSVYVIPCPPPFQGVPYSHSSCPCTTCFYPDIPCFDTCSSSKCIFLKTSRVTQYNYVIVAACLHVCVSLILYYTLETFCLPCMCANTHAVTFLSVHFIWDSGELLRSASWWVSSIDWLCRPWCIMHW